jgi:hypothetical protein
VHAGIRRSLAVGTTGLCLAALFGQAVGAIDPTLFRDAAPVAAGQAQVEVPGSWTGRLERIAVDDGQQRASRTVFYLTGADGSLEVSFTEGTPPTAAGRLVSVTGLRRGDRVEVKYWTYLDEAKRGGALGSGDCLTTGVQKVAVILVSMPTKPLLSYVTVDMMRDTYFGSGPSLDGFLRESSNGAAWASGQVLGHVTLDADYIGQPIAVRDAALRAAAGLADLTTFDRFALVVPQAATGLASGGLGSLGCSTIPLPSGSVVASTTWIGDASLGSAADRVSIAAHELGHNLLLDHARAADFGDEPLGPVGQRPAPWDEARCYGDSFSNMGRGLGHWAAPHKSRLGWLQDGRDVVTVENGGRWSLRPYEEPVGGTRALRVRRGTGNDAWLWIENRQPIGTYDAGLPASAFSGALVHYEDALWADPAWATNLARFATDTGLFFGLAPLVTGATWRDPYSNLTLTVNRGAGGAIDVDVSYAPPPSCPTALTPWTASLDAAGGSGAVDVTAPGGCSWQATTPVAWIQFTSAASGTGPGRVTFSVSPSTISGDRWSRILVGEATAVVRQTGLAGQVSLSPTAVTVPAAGGAGEIAVSTNTPDFSWSWTVDVPWIQSVFRNDPDDPGPGVLRYIVAQNAGAAPRTGTITVGGRTFTVTQEPGGPTVGQVVWTSVPVTDAPSPRIHFGSARLGTTGDALLFGGEFNTTVLADTWIWRDGRWTQALPAHDPGVGRRKGFAMAYDERRGQVILFGGLVMDSPNVYDNATWAWTGTDWIELHPQHRPPARFGHAMSYHAASGKVVLFGGIGADYTDRNDTWEWDGADWTERQVSMRPPARHEFAMADDAGRREIVMFGGRRIGQPFVWLSGTWVWDGVQWQQRTPSTEPTPRESPGMAYHPGLGLVVLVGGQGVKEIINSSSWHGDYREETWAWNGATWTQQFPEISVPFSYSYGMVYDPAGGRLFALLGDDLHCASRGPKAFALTAGPGAILLSSYGAASPAVGMHGTITVNAAVPWTAVTAEPWITITGGSSAGGNTTITYDIEPNSAYDVRRGSITIGGQVFSIRQTHTPLGFSDAPLEAGVTPVKAAHIAELRQCVAALRTRYGLSAVAWTDPTLVPGVTTAKVGHVAELRTALAQVYAAASLAGPTWAHATLTAGATVITAADIEELRAAILAIW